MQRAERDAGADGLNARVVDKAALGELRAAVENAVADRVDLVHAGDNTVCRVDQRVQNGLDRLCVGGHGNVNGVDLLLALHEGLVGELTVDPDALAQALRQKNLAVHINELILQGGAAGVDDKNLHVVKSLSIVNYQSFR